jgi:hypothetical protein
MKRLFLISLILLTMCELRSSSETGTIISGELPLDQSADIIFDYVGWDYLDGNSVISYTIENIGLCTISFYDVWIEIRCEPEIYRVDIDPFTLAPGIILEDSVTIDTEGNRGAAHGSLTYDCIE